MGMSWYWAQYFKASSHRDLSFHGSCCIDSVATQIMPHVYRAIQTHIIRRKWRPRGGAVLLKWNHFPIPLYATVVVMRAAHIFFTSWRDGSLFRHCWLIFVNNSSRHQPSYSFCLVEHELTSLMCWRLFFNLDQTIYRNFEAMVFSLVQLTVTFHSMLIVHMLPSCVWWNREV